MNFLTANSPHSQSFRPSDQRPLAKISGLKTLSAFIILHLAFCISALADAAPAPATLRPSSLFDSVPVEIAAWLGCLAFVLMLLNEGAKFVNGIRGKVPHPPNESLALSATNMAERVQKLEDATGEIWATLRSEDANIRKEMQKTFQEIERSLGRIEGKIDQTTFRSRS